MPDLRTQPGATKPVVQDVAGLIVTGMHRSGTSLVTSALVAAGWRAPGPLIKGNSGNLPGYFEDRKMHDLHRQLLASYGTAWDLGPRLRMLRRKSLSLSPYDEEVSAAVARFRANAPWVWKNPRATLFLDDWVERFPEAKIVICVRSPGAVVDSMLRRGNQLRIGRKIRFYKLKRAARGLSVWHTYNLMAFQFARSHPDRCVVVRVPQDLDQIAAACPGLFDAKLLSMKARARLRIIAGFAVSSQWLYWRLRRLSDTDKLTAVLAGPGLARLSQLDRPSARPSATGLSTDPTG